MLEGKVRSDEVRMRVRLGLVELFKDWEERSFDTAWEAATRLTCYP